MRPRWIALAVALVCGTAHGQSLSDAYRKEVRVLEAEKTELARAVTGADQSAATARRALEGDIRKLTAELVELRADNAGKEVSLPVRERARSVEDQDRQLRDLLGQIETRLLAQGITPPGSGSDPERLAVLIEATLERLALHSSVHVDEDREYFDRKGLARKDRVLHVGELGAVALSTSRPLVPGPDGTLRATPLVGDIDTDSGGQAVRVVIYDPKEPPEPDTYSHTGLAAWMDAGGLIMWPLMALGLIAILIAAERTVSLIRVRFAWQRAHRRAAAPLRAGKTKLPDGPEPGWLQEPLEVLASCREHPVEAEERATESLLRLRARIQRRFTFLGVTAAAAPLMGLLGTVTGMITTFAIITEHGTGDARRVSDGISEALLTTQLGLIIAIPALIVHVGLKRWGHRIFTRAEQNVLDLYHDIHHHPEHGHDHDHAHDPAGGEDGDD
ncbi:MAG: MotA/TolQ/ExbB proton channel family protein [Deltaproteobacteria bacterium]|nr:MotA/TolQ/ExbB proton channel family protein [Deltaproteobacteria bacterium]